MASIWGGVSCAVLRRPSALPPNPVARAAPISAFAPGWCGIQHLRLPPAAIPVPRLGLSPGRCELPGFCSWACLQLRGESLRSAAPLPARSPRSHRHRGLGQVGTDCVQKGALQKAAEAGLLALSASPLQGFVTSATTMWARAKLLPRCGSSDLFD